MQATLKLHYTHPSQAKPKQLKHLSSKRLSTDRTGCSVAIHQANNCRGKKRWTHQPYTMPSQRNAVAEPESRISERGGLEEKQL